MVRLTHLKTGRNLHSHGIPAPLSRGDNEVTGFGDDGEGDTGDNWRVGCLHRKDSRKTSEPAWTADVVVQFAHLDTGAYLSGSPKTKFTPSNCPNCPVIGELEVSGKSRNGVSKMQSSLFRADDGVYLYL